MKATSLWQFDPWQLCSLAVGLLIAGLTGGALIAFRADTPAPLAVSPAAFYSPAAREGAMVGSLYAQAAQATQLRR